MTWLKSLGLAGVVGLAALGVISIPVTLDKFEETKQVLEFQYRGKPAYVECKVNTLFEEVDPREYIKGDLYPGWIRLDNRDIIYSGSLTSDEGTKIRVSDGS